MRYFGTQGRVRPEQHYIVPRTEEINNFINRIKAGKYIVLFAPRQTGKTTFFRLALDALTTKYPTFFRSEPQPRVETETVEGVKIRSYVIPVIQEQPSVQFNLSHENP